MNDHTIHRLDSSRKAANAWPRLLIGTIGAGLVLAGLQAHAGESQTPWECSSYTGAAHTHCLEAFVESQRDQIATLQGKMQAQQETVNHLRNQIDRQSSTNADQVRQLTQPPAVVQAGPPLYAYPPIGLGLYVGRPWIYGSPYYYRPYVYGPHYYGHRHRGHH